jgi:Domain of unknown function (DUF5602)
MISSRNIAIRIALFAVGIVSITMVGCTDNTTSPTKGGTFYGAPVTMGHGKARTFVKLDDNGKPTEYGVAMNEAAMTGLPGGDPNGHSHEYNYVLNLPTEAKELPVNHLEINWNPNGHEPEHIYTLPHFDFHFYTISQQERDGITAVGADTLKVMKIPEAQYAPAGYIQIPGGVPRMGSHWIDPTSPEFNGHAFTKTYIYGFYDGKMAFFEPMITKAYLESKPNATETVKMPQAFQKSGYYPGSYTVGYDAATKEYVVSFGALKKG